LVSIEAREDSIVDRRSFLASLIGGLAAASFASSGSFASTGLTARPQATLPADRRRPEGAPEVDTEALDKADADYAQYYYYRPRRGYWRRRYYGPRYYRGPRYWGPRYYRPYPYYYRPYRRYWGPRYYW
jgi:hypothetical protein